MGKSRNDHKRISPLGGTREERIAKVKNQRYTDVELVLEQVDDPHNIGAILRSCEAFGIQAVHLLYHQTKPPRLSEIRSTSAASAVKWLTIKKWSSIDDCISDIKKRNLSIYATALDPNGKPHFAYDLTQPLAIIIGNEKDGISTELLSYADHIITIPMRGFVQSLNVSVAAAVVLSEILRQRSI
ncbi:RNA methyltransferase [Patescibacteria group bacterium]|nr:RNA methyltransferase [Patescibacteria group bacterium]